MRILVATDFSPRSQRAIRRAGILARQNRADVILMHAVEEVGMRGAALDLHEAQRTIVEQIAVVPELAGVPCEPVVVGGCPPDAILTIARDWDVDLIVVGVQQGAHSRAVGKTVKRLIRDAPCAVLAVKQAAIGLYASVLAPVELSDISASALRTASSLDLFGRAEVTVVHAFIALAKRRLYSVGITSDRIDEYVKGCRAWHVRELDDFLEAARVTAAPWMRRVEEGSPVEVVSRVAKKMRPELLVIGTHGRAGLRKMLIGSVTEDLLSVLDADTLVVPPEEPGSNRSASDLVNEVHPGLGQLEDVVQLRPNH